MGIADLLTFNVVGDGLSYLGYAPESSRKMLSNLYSEKRQQSERAFEQAEGFSETIGALIDNPDKNFRCGNRDLTFNDRFSCRC